MTDETQTFSVCRLTLLLKHSVFQVFVSFWIISAATSLFHLSALFGRGRHEMCLENRSDKLVRCGRMISSPRQLKAKDKASFWQQHPAACDALDSSNKASSGFLAEVNPLNEKIIYVSKELMLITVKLASYV